MRTVRRLVDSGELTILVEIDGGINAATIEQAAEAGVTASSPGRRSTAPAIRARPSRRCAARPGPPRRICGCERLRMTGPDLAAAMRLAAAQSQRVKGSTYPNPPVGAVILSAGW